MEKKILAYSLLAHINNQTPTESSYESIFIPLVKRGLSKMCATGQFKGDDINDIKKHIDDLYGLNMPETILKKILFKIASELNTKDKVVIQFFSGGSFIIGEYVFSDYEDEINKRNDELERLQRIFNEFLKAEGKEENSESIFEFVEQNKISIGKYINKKYPTEHNDNTTEARFINFIKPVKELYSVVQSVYIGSIISTYLEYQPTGIKRDVELVLDTNFIISLIDLNTSSSTANCRRLLDIATKLGYKFTVLAITIREIEQLLKTRVDNFDSVFLSKQVDPEDIYNACERRNLSRTDLDRIRHNITSEIEKFNVVILSKTEAYEKRARFSDEYEKLKEVRNTTFAALHDATCIDYVKEKRGRPIYDFHKVNCWFVNNSSSRSNQHSNGAQPYVIKAEDLLNLLWLASPMVKANISNTDISSIGLSRLVSATLDDSLPSALTIKKLDDNIRKYADGNISDEDIVRVSKAIAERTITNLDDLNKLADDDDSRFVETLQNIASTQKKKEDEFTHLLNKLVEEISRKSKILDEKTFKIDKEKEGYEQLITNAKSKQQEALDSSVFLAEQVKLIRSENIRLQNEIRKPKREKFIRNKVFWWRARSFFLVLVGPVVLIITLCYVVNLNSGDLKLSKEFLQKYTNNIIFSSLISLASLIYSGIFIKIFADRFNHSALNAYKNGIEVPAELKNLQENE